MKVLPIMSAWAGWVEWSLAVGTSAPISQPDNGWIALRRRSREHESPLVQEGWRWELPHVSLDKGMIKSRTEASRMVRGGRQSTVRGALYESTSIAAVYGTICSLVWEPWGQP